MSKIAVLHITSPTTTGVQTYTDNAQLGGDTPKLAIAFGGGVTSTSGGTDSDTQLSFGASDGTTSGVLAGSAEGGVGTSNTNRKYQAGAAAPFVGLLFLDGSGFAVSGDLDSFVTDGISINWTSVLASGVAFTIYLFAGSDVDVDVRSIQRSSASYDIGFQPDGLFVGTIGIAPSTGADNLIFTLGVVDGASNNRAFTASNPKGENISNVDQLLNTNDAAAQVFNNSLSWDLDFTIDSVGYDTTTVGSDSDELLVVAFAFGDRDVEVADISTPTSSVSDWTVSNLSSEPAFGLMLANTVGTSDSIETTSSVFGMAGFLAGEQARTYHILSEDSAGTTNEQSRYDDKFAALVDPADKTTLIFDFSNPTFASNGWTVAAANIGATDSVSRTWPGLFVSGVADTDAPTLTNASGTSTGQNTADGSVDTDEANGTLYWVTAEDGTGTPTASQIKNGANANGNAAQADGSQAVTATGTQNISATGLLAATTYRHHFMHEDDAGNQAAVASSATFTTDSAATATSTTEPGTASDTFQAQVSSPVSLTEPASAGETPTTAATAILAVLEAASAADARSATATATTSLTEGINAADTESTPQSGGATRSVTEGAQASDTFATTASASGSVTEPASGGSAYSVTARVASALTEAVSAADADAGPAQALEAISAGATGNDLADAVAQAAAALTAGAAAGDTWTVQAQAFVDLLETGSAGDTVTQGAQAVQDAAIAEGTTAGDAFAEAIRAVGALTDTATAADAVIATLTAMTSVTETARAGAAFNVGSAALKQLDATAQASDLATAIVQITTAITETAGAGAMYAAAASVAQSLTEGATASDSWVGVVGGIRYMTATAITITAALSGKVKIRPA